MNGLGDGSSASAERLRSLYLDLIKRVLTRQDFDEVPSKLRLMTWKRHILEPLQRLLSAKGLQLTSTGRATPNLGETMISSKRLDNLQRCVESVINEGVPGDLIEAGVWRGGATILMRAVLAAYGVSDRTVWAADSFHGFPASTDRGREIDRETDATAGMGEELFRVSLADVKRNFARYGLLDHQVRFLAGWFSETLHRAPIKRLAVLRLDCDLYESTWDALDALYPKLSVGGYLIVDDYGRYEACRQAVHAFRAHQNITDSIEWIDDEGVFWRRNGDVTFPEEEHVQRG
jgi:hypothetical protein